MHGSVVVSDAPRVSDAAIVSERARLRFERFAWAALGYTVLVILFGAIVRITGSGAGCGQHWPTCQGEIIHLPRSTATAIELTHRLTSGLSIAATIALVVLGFRAFERGHVGRRVVVWALTFMAGEALIGAALVLLALVGKNDSLGRAAVMAAHLVNTSLLTGSIAVAAWLSGTPGRRLGRLDRTVAIAFAAGLVAVLVTSTTGAMTALGDTLYPIAPGADVRARVTGAHFLERLRWIHPLVAALTAGFLIWLSTSVPERLKNERVRAAARRVLVLVVVQAGAGVANVLLSAPGYMQVVHLGIATLLWIALVLLGAEATIATGARFATIAKEPIPS